MSDESNTEHILKQYQLACETADTHVRETIEDWKAPGVIAVTVAWIPIARILEPSKEPNITLPDLLLFGFLAAVAIGTIMGFRLILRLSLVYYALNVAYHYEKLLKHDHQRQVDNIKAWDMWQKDHHGGIFFGYVGIWLLFFSLFPPGVLWYADGLLQAGIYILVYFILISSVVVLGLRTYKNKMGKIGYIHVELAANNCVNRSGDPAESEANA